MSVGKISYIVREGCIRFPDSWRLLPVEVLEPFKYTVIYWAAG
jgi:hypothetical protein